MLKCGKMRSKEPKVVVVKRMKYLYGALA